MTVSFGDAGTKDIYDGRRTARSRHIPVTLWPGVVRKLDMLNAAKSLDDLRALPGNRLEVLKGSLRGKWSIRVNEQWRIVFRWFGGNAHDVTVTDYH